MVELGPSEARIERLFSSPFQESGVKISRWSGFCFTRKSPELSGRALVGWTSVVYTLFLFTCVGPGSNPFKGLTDCKRRSCGGE